MDINYNAYKAYINNIWMFGDLETKFNDKLEKEFWLVTENAELKVDKDELCKCINIKDSKDNYIYENDIVNILDSEGMNYQFIIKVGQTEIDFEGGPVYLDGLYFKDFEDRSFIFGKAIVDNSKYITIVGNTIENNIKDL